jgi:hypothetical protein
MSNTNKVVMNLISNKMENKKYHASGTVSKSNNEKQKHGKLLIENEIKKLCDLTCHLIKKYNIFPCSVL